MQIMLVIEFYSRSDGKPVEGFKQSANGKILAVVSRTDGKKGQKQGRQFRAYCFSRQKKMMPWIKLEPVGVGSLLQAELSPSKICMLKPCLPVPQNVTLFGDRTFKEAVKLK